MSACACLYAECRKVGYCLAKKKALDFAAKTEYNTYQPVKLENKDETLEDKE